MTDWLKAFRTPTVEVVEILNILATAADSLPVLESGGMRIRFVEPGHGRLIFPVGLIDEETANGAAYKHAEDRIIAAFNEGPAQFSKRAGSHSMLLAGAVPPSVAALEIALRASPPDSASWEAVIDPADPVGNECLTVMEGSDLPVQFDHANTIVRRCPMARLGVRTEANDGDAYIVLYLNDDPDRRSALGGLVARGDMPPGHVLARYDTAAGPVFLPRDRTVPRTVLRALGKVLRPFADTVDGGENTAFGVFHDAEGNTTFRTALPVEDARTVLEDERAGEEIAWRFLDLRDSAEATGRLRAMLGELKTKPGYRLSLHEVGTKLKRNLSIERLREAIADLEAHAMLVQGLQAKQLRLLRFSAEQLPAMADFLLRVPVSEVDRGTVRYGFQASALEPRGTHFLLFDPEEFALERPFPEWEWRTRTTDRPILYWVDPHWADHYKGGMSQVRSVVFTPYETVLHPTLHSFSTGDMDGYLRSLMMARFANEEHNAALGEMLRDHHRSAGFVFDHSPDPDFEISVEVLDLDAFAPVRERLDWINDHLLLVDPSVVDPLRITQVAEALFEGRAAAALLEETKAQARELDALSREVETGFVRGIGSIMRRVESEIAAMSERSAEAISFLEDVAARMTVLEQLMDEGLRNLLSATSEAEKLDSVATDLEVFREIFENRLRGEFERTDHFIAAAEKRIDKTRHDLSVLHSKLEELRNGR